MTDSADSPTFRLAYVPGATPAKWARIWTERYPRVRLELLQAGAAEASDVLRSGGADAGLVRLPVDRETFSAIPLYTETTVAVVPKDHLITAAEEITLADLAEETVLHPLDDVFAWEQPPGEPAFERPETTADAIDLVAAGIGVLLTPQSLARLHHRRDLTYRPVTDAPQSAVALSWPTDATTDLVDDFIGVVRGRTANSTRGRTKQEQPKPAAKKSPAKKAPVRKATTGKAATAGKATGKKPARKTASPKPRRHK
ncbi:LysR family substrate-binding domain-containing protein [Streptomyces roseirectus]|uniref:LysR family substrate-binding domain-containing protein n=1 Tax=Streptomyces roseirectus TaxID=2768066 RepID=A0A7H0I855_9ACTN|nr:LysR family substrate-binding domain-containing protein [Streptomyces roseirectus]QNP68971.1 LysR family substrate-binding domain-containing protein [Streptomyces roseirectus]